MAANTISIKRLKKIVGESVKGFLYHALRGILKVIFSIFYKIEVRGLDNLKNLTGKNVMIANHVSSLDPILLALYIPGRPVFALNREVAQKWWVRPVLALSDVFEIDPTNSFHINTLIKKVRMGRNLVIFSEGRISETNSLMKIYEAPGLIADKAKADIIPIMIDGPQHSSFSKMKGKLTLKTFPKLSINIFEKRKLKLRQENLRERREEIAEQLYNIMLDCLFVSNPIMKQNMFEALLEVSSNYGRQGLFKQINIFEDQNRAPITFDRLITSAHALGGKFAQKFEKGEIVGLVMPNTIATVVAFFGLQAYGMVVAMINFTSGKENVLSALRSAQIKKIVTAKAFIKQAGLEELIELFKENGLQVVYLEDVAKMLSTWDKIYALLLQKFKINTASARNSDPAVVLFTSGSEGKPKGVVLSHQNILSNVAQVKAALPLNQTDGLLNALPMFHSLGLIATMLPMYLGLKTFLYPSPLHYKVIPQLFYECGASVILGTDTFMRGYAENAHAYDFYNLRYAVLGGEKQKAETAAVWGEKFGVRILEGYGATECSPLISLCTPMHIKKGSVGKAVAGMETKIVEIPGIENGGELWVKGPNVMLGYYKEDNPGVIQPPANGWYDTGDIVEIDDGGFIFIKGRAKRFAKIGGEMVSLTAVEDLVNSIWNGEEINHAVIAVPDDKKGERLILITSAKDANVADLIKAGQERGFSELMFPRTIEIWDEIPKMLTGKIDYVKIINTYYSEHINKS
ncbi:MAG: AMP-binding protein [Rickettsiales bacterium]|jgi:acyl-[acyl-carrier-protein]-phospholipid O-acyltransferase/long-chain-fatty-acid--[acyl-carrier-protein] ligase|nr:AMP-binding protein [Rickettsiales bacterium]